MPKTVLFFWVNAQIHIKGKGTDKARSPDTTQNDYMMLADHSKLDSS